MPESHRHLAAQARAALVGTAGAVLAALAGLPAAALIGSSLAVAVAAAAKLSLEVHPRVRDAAFAVIGISLGAGVQPGLLDRLGDWTLSLVLLAVSLLATMLSGAALLRRGFGKDGDTALLASSPGTLSNVVALALEGRGDATAVIVLQVMRVLVLVAVVPPLATALDSPDRLVTPGAPMDLVALALLLAATLALGAVGARLRVPAACLLGGMILSSAAHVAGLAHGPAPQWAVFAAFVATGAALGTRLTAVTPRQLAAMAGAGLALVATAVAVSLGFAALTTTATGLPFGQVWIAFAPGGVEAMAAIGLALGYDPAYVAAHHFARILNLVLLLPLLMKRRARQG